MQSKTSEPSSPQVTTSKPHPKAKFTKEEDAMLSSIVSQMNGKIYWQEVSNQMPGRNQRQCKERWENYLSPNVNRTPFTPNEDILLLEKFNEYGTKWVLISKFFNNRSDTSIKSRYLVLKRRGVTLDFLRTHDAAYLPQKLQKGKKTQQVVSQNVPYQQNLMFYQQQMQQMFQMQQMQLMQQQQVEEQPIAKTQQSELDVDQVINNMTEETQEELGTLWSWADPDTSMFSNSLEFDF